ncbi:hypothetical protein HOJ01_03580 [bacterium]|jgi:tRNA G10  N-methylase Trm11|nr:hypothetical protein [bacterium]MBT6293862.1 hypothetical protein [bacterium]
MYFYDACGDTKQFDIETYNLGFTDLVYQEDFKLLSSETLVQPKPASVRCIYKVIKKLDNSDFKSELVNFIKNNPFKKYFINSNLLSKKEILTQLYDVKKSVKFHFDADVNTFLLSKRGFFKQKVAVLALMRFDRKFYFCELIDADNVSQLEMFDYKKPYRKQRQGMMPPKLALFMLNLLGKDVKSVYDPFCGTGTTLMLALKNGLSFKGSDISEDNIPGSLENLEYISNKFDVDYDSNSVFQKDALKISSEDLKGISSICSEGFLGKPKAGNEELIDLVRESDNLADFYLDFLENLSGKIESGFPIVMTFPVYKTEKRLVFMDTLYNNLKDIGFKQVKLHPKHMSYLYSRDDQRVLRQVVKIVKV